jgi:D-amino-acid dehydrogenase
LAVSRRVVVVGGGLVGSSAAYRVACQGAEAVLVDRADAGQATAAGAGIISPGGRFEDGDPDLLGLVRTAVAWYPELLERLAEDGEVRTGYEVVGALHVATSEQEAGRLEGLLGDLRRRRAEGFSHIGEAAIVDPATARARFPALGPVRAAVHIPGAARVDGRLLRDALHRALRRRGGTTLEGGARLLLARGGERAAGVHVGGETLAADAVIVAGGAWSAALADDLGVSLPVAPQRGQIAHLELPGMATGEWPIVLGFHSHYLLTFPANRVVAGATREYGAGYDHRITAAGMHEVLGEALRLAPGLAAATVLEMRIGFRPASPDGKPVLGPAPQIHNLYFATGHGPYGLQVGPWSGAAVADLALGRQVGPDLGPFTVARFAGGRRLTSSPERRAGSPPGPPR